MKVITAKQQRDLDNMLEMLKEKDQQLYGKLEFHLSDLGNGIMIGIPYNGFQNVTGFMSYEAMWYILHSLLYPINDKIHEELEFIEWNENMKKHETKNG